LSATFKVAFLDTVPYLFLFSKHLPTGKSAGELFQENGYRFCVSNSCWRGDHFEKWKKLEDVSPDFRHLDYLYYLSRYCLRANLETPLADKVQEYLEGSLRRNLLHIVDRIRSSKAFRDTKPSYEETEVVLLAILLEKCRSIKCECCTIVLLGDDIHSMKLAEVFDKNLRLSYREAFQYPKSKCFTLIDFLANQSVNSALPENYIDALIDNYAKLKVFASEIDFLDRFLQELPITQASSEAWKSANFENDFSIFCDNMRKIVLESYVELVKAYYKSIIIKDPRMVQRATETITILLEKKCSDLIAEFTKKYPKFMSSRIANRTQKSVVNLILYMKEKVNSLSKYATMK
jgi:hypothetical protein